MPSLSHVKTGLTVTLPAIDNTTPGLPTVPLRGSHYALNEDSAPLVLGSRLCPSLRNASAISDTGIGVIDADDRRLNVFLVGCSRE